MQFFKRAFEPILFSLFINDLPNVINMFTLLCADDVKIGHFANAPYEFDEVASHTKLSYMAFGLALLGHDNVWH